MRLRAPHLPVETHLQHKYRGSETSLGTCHALLPPAEKLERKIAPVSRAATFQNTFTNVTAGQTDRTREKEIKKQDLALAGSQENPHPFLGQEYSQSGPLLWPPSSLGPLRLRELRKRGC